MCFTVNIFAIIQEHYYWAPPKFQICHENYFKKIG